MPAEASQGSITDLFLPRLVARLHREGFEGALRVTSDPHTRILYFRNGEIASAASNAEPDRLANVLIQDGRLTGEQLDLARTRVPAGGSLGKTLIEMGFVTPGELLQGARRQVREILSACFSLSSGTYRIEPGPLPPEVTVLGLPTRRLLFDCLLQCRDRGFVVREMGSMESVYGPTDETIPGLGALKLDIEMDRIGRSLDGTLSLRDLSGRTSLDDFTVSKVVLALELLGMAQRFGEPPVAEDARRSGRAIPVTSGEPQEEPEPWAAAGESDDAIVIEDEPADEPSRPYVPAAAGAGAAAPAAAWASGEAPEGPAAESYSGEAAEAPPESSYSGEAPEAPAGDSEEPSPGPPGELPAFALPPDASPEWQVDPDTGERVHVGPIEVTFDGRIPPRRPGERSVRRLATIAAAITLVLGGAAFHLISRRGGGAGLLEKAGREEPPGAGAAAARSDDRGAPASAEPPPALPAPRGGGPAAPEIEAGAPAPPGPLAQGPAVPDGPSPREPRAGAKPSAGPPPHGSVSPFGRPSRYAAALRQFDDGDTEKAARIFQELAAAEAPNRYTLQLLIACEVETLRKARARSGDQGSLFFVPFVLGGRDCYRACWGNYPDVSSARAAAAALPPLVAGGLKPIVVSLGRLQPRE
jgi:hypothetical protein